MQGTRKADIDVMKGFLSRQVDEYRAAYGHVVERHPRTAIICGATGNRRFWPVSVDGGGRLSVWEMTEATRAQIWAEAAMYATEGEDSFLDAEMEKEAARAQQAALMYDEREGQVIDYLDTLLPEDWYSWDLGKRKDYFSQRDVLDPKQQVGTMQRTKVSAMEIFCECFGKIQNQWTRRDGDEIASIMARLPEWERPANATMRIKDLGKQRVFVRRSGNGNEGGR